MAEGENSEEADGDAKATRSEAIEGAPDVAAAPIADVIESQVCILVFLVLTCNGVARDCVVSSSTFLNLMSFRQNTRIVPRLWKVHNNGVELRRVREFC